MRSLLKYEDVIEVGPRYISKVHGFPLVYLPKELAHLHGRRAMVILKLLPGEPKVKYKRRK